MIAYTRIRETALLLLTLSLISTAACSPDKPGEQAAPGQAARPHGEPAGETAGAEAGPVVPQGTGEADGAAGRTMEKDPQSRMDEAVPPGVQLPDPSTRRDAPDFTLQDLSGRDVRLSDFRGKVVLLNFWATWCPPCRMEIPDFIRLQRDYQDKGLEIVGVSMDREGARIVAPFARQYGINYTMLVDGTPVAGRYGGITGVPTTFILDRQGRIVTMLQGYNPMAVWVALVEAVIAEG